MCGSPHRPRCRSIARANAASTISSKKPAAPVQHRRVGRGHLHQQIARPGHRERVSDRIARAAGVSQRRQILVGQTDAAIGAAAIDADNRFLWRQNRRRLDAEALRVYFPYDKVLQGMFDIYQRIFSLKIEEAASAKSKKSSSANPLACRL